MGRGCSSITVHHKQAFDLELCAQREGTYRVANDQRTTLRDADSSYIHNEESDEERKAEVEC